MKTSWPDYMSQAKASAPHVVAWPYVESREHVRSVAALLCVTVGQAAKILATISLCTDDRAGALKLCADLLSPTPLPTDAAVDRACDRLFDCYRERWWA
jgi:hypothetical protein